MLHEFIATRLLGLFFLVIAVTLAAVAVMQAQSGANSKPDSPVGDWRGMSFCQVKPSGCHDEDSLYHFKQVMNGPDSFELQADKIVDGKPVTMGKGPCSYGAAGELVCPIPATGASMIFEVHGDKMQGTMKMRDGTIWRKLTLKRV